MQKWKVLFFSSLCLLFPIFLSAQWLETTIYLPDSLTGVVYPQAFTYNVTNNTIYVGGSSGHCIIAIDGTTNQKIAKIPAGSDIIDLCWNSIDNKVYCANWGDDFVTVIDGITNSVITNIQLEEYPNALVYNINNNKVYCAIDEGDKVAVIDGATDTVIKNIPVGDGPLDLVYNQISNKIYCKDDGGTLYIIDGVTDTTITSIALGYGYPSDLVFNSTLNKVYVSNYSWSNVTVIDGATDSVLATIPVGYRPTALAFNSINNKIYSANTDSSVSIIDGVNDSVIVVVSAGNRPCALVYNPTENKVYCANNSSNDVTVIDGETNEINVVIQVENNPCALIYNPTNNEIYCANSGSSNLSIINGQTNQVIMAVQLVYGTYFLIYNPLNNKIYSANRFSDNVTVFDGGTNDVIATIEVGDNPFALVYNPTNNKIYCANNGSSDVTIIDGASNQIITTVQVGSGPYALTYNPIGDKIYCANYNSDNLTVIDGATDTVITSIQVGNAPRALIYNSSNNKVYSANRRSDDVAVIDGELDSMITIIETDDRPYVLAYNTINNKVYCGHSSYRSDNLIIIDGEADTVIVTIDAADDVRALIYNPDNNKVYCANNDDDNVMVIDGTTDSIITTISVGNAPHKLIYNPVNNKIYCANRVDDNVSIIDVLTNQVINTIGVGDYPIAFALNPQQNRAYVANYYGSSISVIRDFISDVGVTQIISPTGMIDSGSVVIPRAVMKNFGTHQSSSFPAIFRIGEFYFDSQDVPELLPGDSIVVDFVSWDVSQIGIHPVKCSTSLFRDQNSLNDAVIDTILVLREFDVGAVSILSPIGTVDSGTTIIPQTIVKNFGFAPADFPVWLKIYNNNNLVVRKSPIVSQFSASLTGENQTTVKQLGINQDKIKSQSEVDSQSGYDRFSEVKINSKDEKHKVDQIYEDVIWLSLEPGDSVIGEFQSWIPISPGEYYIESFTALPEDMNPLNDTVHDSIFVRTLDVSINRIITPTGIIDSGLVVVPQVVINNLGNTEVSFPITFKISNFYSDTVNISNLSPYDSTTVNFQTWTVLERGTHIIKCTTALIGDINPVNNFLIDTVTVQVLDVGVDLIIAPSGVIDSGSTVTPMVKVKNYGTTETSFPVWFRIQSDTENLRKPFKITSNKTNLIKTKMSHSKEIKSDAVISFDQIYEDSVWLPLAPDDSIFAVFDQWTATIPDTYLIQSFTTFIEDMNPSNDSAYGSVIVSRPFHDVGVINILVPADTVDSNNILIPTATVKNYGLTTVSFPVFFRDSISNYYDVQQVNNLQPDSTCQIRYHLWRIMNPRGEFLVKCSTALPYDINNSNDAYEKQIFCRVKDVTVCRIFFPDIVDSGTTVIPQVEVKNLGNSLVTFPTWFKIHCANKSKVKMQNTKLKVAKINTKLIASNILYETKISNLFDQIYEDSACLTLPPEDSIICWFRPWTATIPDTYRLESFTELQGDINRRNDTTYGSVIVRSSVYIAEPSNFQFLPKSFALENCQPNPFKDQTIIRYALPKKCQINLYIYNSFGILVQTLKTGDKDIGYNRFIWYGDDDKGNKVSKGVYFYRLETDGFISTKKMLKLE